VAQQRSDVFTGIGAGTSRTRNNSRDDVMLLTVGYVCYITITGGSSQHGAVVLFDLYVAASERSHLDAA